MDFTIINQIDPLALWGALLSTILAVREIYKSRLRLEVGFTFTGDIDGIGNKVFIRNLSGKTVIVTYYQIQVCKKKHIGWKLIDAVIETDEHFNDLTLAPYSSSTFQFSGSEYFSTNPKDYCADAFFFYLVVSGKKKPLKLKIWDVNS